jgi:hypothetical protein
MRKLKSAADVTEIISLALLHQSAKTCFVLLLLVLGSERSHGLSCSPDLQVADLLHLSLVFLAVVRLGVVLE